MSTWVDSMNITSVLIMLVVLLVLARIGSRVFARFGIPGLIGEIIVGAIIANLTIGDWSFLGMLDIRMGSSPSENYDVLRLFAELGVIFLLFAIGLETKVNDLLSVGKAATLVAVMGVIVPFIFGLAFIELIDGNIHHALFMAAAMVATSVGITARVIKDMKLIDTKESRIIIGAAVIDDILGMIVLAIVIGMAGSGESFSLEHVITISLEAIVFVVAVIAAAKWVIPRISERAEKRRDAQIAEKGEHRPLVNKLFLALIICLGFAWIAESIGLAAIIGAFLGGMLLADHAWEWGLEDKIESISSLFLSFFFLNVGMQINLGECASLHIVWMSAILVILAVLSKYIGCSIGAKMGDRTLDRDSVNIIGVGMIPRGEVGIIVAAKGLECGALSNELYTIVIVMAVVTTIIAPPLLSRAFRRKYKPDYSITVDDI